MRDSGKETKINTLANYGPFHSGDHCDSYYHLCYGRNKGTCLGFSVSSMREFKDRLKRNFEDYFIRVQKKNFRWEAISLDRRTEEEGGEEEGVTVFELSWLGGQPHGR